MPRPVSPKKFEAVLRAQRKRTVAQDCFSKLGDAETELHAAQQTLDAVEAECEHRKTSLCAARRAGGKKAVASAKERVRAAKRWCANAKASLRTEAQMKGARRGAEHRAESLEAEARNVEAWRPGFGPMFLRYARAGAIKTTDGRKPRYLGERFIEMMEEDKENIDAAFIEDQEKAGAASVARHAAAPPTSRSMARYLAADAEAAASPRSSLRGPGSTRAPESAVPSFGLPPGSAAASSAVPSFGLPWSARGAPSSRSVEALEREAMQGPSSGPRTERAAPPSARRAVRAEDRRRRAERARRAGEFRARATLGGVNTLYPPSAKTQISLPSSRRSKAVGAPSSRRAPPSSGAASTKRRPAPPSSGRARCGHCLGRGTQTGYSHACSVCGGRGTVAGPSWAGFAFGEAAPSSSKPKSSKPPSSSMSRSELLRLARGGHTIGKAAASSSRRGPAGTVMGVTSSRKPKSEPSCCRYHDAGGTRELCMCVTPTEYDAMRQRARDDLRSLKPKSSKPKSKPPSLLQKIGAAITGKPAKKARRAPASKRPSVARKPVSSRRGAAGVTACRDGSPSSASSRGACSSHGGFDRDLRRQRLVNVAGRLFALLRACPNCTPRQIKLSRVYFDGAEKYEPTSLKAKLADLMQTIVRHLKTKNVSVDAVVALQKALKAV